MNYELNNQMKNRDKAINAAKDYIDCVFSATPEFREQICNETISLLCAKASINPDANQALNLAFEMQSLLNSFGLCQHSPV